MPPPPSSSSSAVAPRAPPGAIARSSSSTTGGGQQPPQQPAAGASAANNNNNNNNKRQRSNNTTNPQEESPQRAEAAQQDKRARVATAPPPSVAAAEGGGSSSSNAQQQQQQTSSVLQTQANSIRQCMTSCITRSMHPSLQGLDVLPFYRFASCADRMMHTLFADTLQTLRRPEDAQGLARGAILAFIERERAATEEPKRLAAARMEDVLRIADEDVLRTEWPLLGPETLQQADGPQNYEKVRDVPVDHLLLKAGVRVVPPPPPPPDFSVPPAVHRPTRLPSVEALRFVSPRGQGRELFRFGFGFNEWGQIETRDSYFDSLRYAMSVLKNHALFKAASPADARALLAAKRNEAFAALDAPAFQATIEGELRALVDDGERARRELDALLAASDSGAQIRTATEAVAAIEAKIEACRRDMDSILKRQLESVSGLNDDEDEDDDEDDEDDADADADEEEEEDDDGDDENDADYIPSAAGGSGKRRNKKKKKNNNKPKTKKRRAAGDPEGAEFAERLRQLLAPINTEFARRLDKLEALLAKRRAKLAEVTARAQGGNEAVQALQGRIAAGQEARASDGAEATQRVRDQIRTEIGRFLAELEPFAEWAEPDTLKALLLDLRDVTLERTVLMDARMAIYRATRRYFVSAERRQA